MLIKITSTPKTKNQIQTKRSLSLSLSLSFSDSNLNKVSVCCNMNLLVKNDDACRDGVCNDVVVDLILFPTTTTIAPSTSMVSSSSSVPLSLPATFSRYAVLGTLLIFVLCIAFVERPRFTASIDFLHMQE